MDSKARNPSGNLPPEVRMKHVYRDYSLVFQPPGFADIAAEVGVSLDMESIKYFSCAWYFCRVAHESLERYKDDVVMEDEVDPTSTLRVAMEAVMRIYDLVDVERVGNMLTGPCRLAAFRRRLPWASRFQAWLDSGGHSYNTLTREPPN